LSERLSAPFRELLANDVGAHRAHSNSNARELRDDVRRSVRRDVFASLRTLSRASA
jgi:hypothetical protein